MVLLPIFSLNELFLGIPEIFLKLGKMFAVFAINTHPQVLGKYLI